MGAWKSSLTASGVVVAFADERRDSRRSVCGMLSVVKGSLKRLMTTIFLKSGHSLKPPIMPLILSLRSMTLPLYSAPSSKKTNCHVSNAAGRRKK